MRTPIKRTRVSNPLTRVSLHTNNSVKLLCSHVGLPNFLPLYRSLFMCRKYKILLQQFEWPALWKSTLLCFFIRLNGLEFL